MAQINVGGGSTNTLLIIGAIIAILALIYLIRKNSNFLKSFPGNLSVAAATRLSRKIGQELFQSINKLNYYLLLIGKFNTSISWLKTI